ncbi:MAG: hypothetical protein QM811_01800 [Pirellulales bacterium]
MNYEYWRLLIRSEKENDAYEAHKTTYEAKRLLKSNPYEAAKTYEKAFCHWRALLNAYPALRNDNVTADDINEIIKDYRKALALAELDFPENFILRDIVAIIDDGRAAETVPFPPLCGQEDKTPPKPEGTESKVIDVPPPSSEPAAPETTPTPPSSETPTTTGKSEPAPPMTDAKSAAPTSEAGKAPPPATKAPTTPPAKAVAPTPAAKSAGKK